jgi:hypothetical protein
MEQCIAETIKIMSGVVAVIGLFIGLFQYQKAQIWKRKEFAASLIARIAKEDDLKLAITLLDWKARVLPIPSKYLEVSQGEKIFMHSHLSLASAFDLNNREYLPETNDIELKQNDITLLNIIYIDTFDRFFEFLEEVYAYVSIGIIRIEDISLLIYWADRIATLQFEGKQVFVEYLIHYHLHGVLKLSTSGQYGI